MRGVLASHAYYIAFSDPRSHGLSISHVSPAIPLHHKIPSNAYASPHLAAAKPTLPRFLSPVRFSLRQESPLSLPDDPVSTSAPIAPFGCRATIAITALRNLLPGETECLQTFRRH